MEPRDEEQVAEFESNVTAFYSNPQENHRLHSWIMNYHTRQGSSLVDFSEALKIALLVLQVSQQESSIYVALGTSPFPSRIAFYPSNAPGVVGEKIKRTWAVLNPNTVDGIRNLLFHFALNKGPVVYGLVRS